MKLLHRMMFQAYQKSSREAGFGRSAVGPEVRYTDVSAQSEK
ncbi:MAG: hypothetical protein ACE5K0_01975 [Candidatus Methanofastidiosia archaeon]